MASASLLPHKAEPQTTDHTLLSQVDLKVEANTWLN